MENELVGLFLYAKVKRQKGVSDDDELYYAVLDELEKHGWYDSKDGLLYCHDDGELEVIVDDYMEGFNKDFPGLQKEIRALVESRPPAYAPEMLFVYIFETLRRMLS